MAASDFWARPAADKVQEGVGPEKVHTHSGPASRPARKVLNASPPGMGDEEHSFQNVVLHKLLCKK